MNHVFALRLHSSMENLYLESVKVMKVCLEKFGIFYTSVCTLIFFFFLFNILFVTIFLFSVKSEYLKFLVC